MCRSVFTSEYAVVDLLQRVLATRQNESRWIRHERLTPHFAIRYLIRIYTNWRPRSGTRSKIFIQLHGNLAQNTICYFLHNPFLPYRQLFVWGDCSFFVINTANPVGEIHVSRAYCPKRRQLIKSLESIRYSELNNIHLLTFNHLSITAN